MFVRTKVVRRGQKQYRYLQLVQNERIDGKVRQKVVCSLGRLDSLDESQIDGIVRALARYTDQAHVLRHIEALHLHEATHWGDIWVLTRLWQDIGLPDIFASLLSKRHFEIDVECALRAMVLNRCIAPASKRATYDWVNQHVRFPHADEIALHHFYRALDFLVQEQHAWEAALYHREMDLFSLDVSLVFYDTTLVSVYGDGEQADLIQPSRRSRRTQLKELLLGLVLSRDGMPLAHEVLPGNTPDVTTVTEVTQRLQQRFGIQRCIFVGDRGMFSGDNLTALEALKYEYVLGVPLRKLSEVRQEVLSRPGRYQVLSDNLHIKQVTVGEVTVGEHRYVLCHNPKQAQRDAAIREAFLKTLQDEIQQLQGKQHTLQYRELIAHRRKRRYLRILKDGSLRLHRAQVAEDARYDGKHVLRTNTTLSSEEVAQSYRSLRQIEQSFHSLKSLEEVAPVYHWTDERIRGHVAVCVLAHWLERFLERKLRDSGYEGSVATALKALGRLKSVLVELNGQWFQFRTEADPEVARIIQALGYRLPRRIEPLLEVAQQGSE